MKPILTLLLASFICSFAVAQSPHYKEDLATVFETIKKRAFKNSYNYVITYDNVNDASMFVKPKKSYLILYVYDISPRQAINFTAYLMTGNKEIQKKYTGKPHDVGIVGSAKVSRLDFTTPDFSGEQRPVKIEAHPAATIYIFEK